MPTVLGGPAEFERELIKAHTAEGRGRAKAQGVKFGCKNALNMDQCAYMAKLRADGGSVRQIARVMGVIKAAISRIQPSP